MDEYIKKLTMRNCCIDEDGRTDEPIIKKLNEVIDFINSIDVAPVRHGRWEWCKDYDGDSILVCSECGRVCHEEDAPYCYCGAKMDGGFDNG